MPGVAYRDAATLRELYHEEEMSLRDIADKFDTSDNTICYWMEKLDIPRRTRQGGMYVSGYDKIRGDEYECEFCDLSYGTYKALLNHEQRNHPEDLRFDCPYDECDRSLKTEHALNRHYGRAHDEPLGELVCEQCGDIRRVSPFIASMYRFCSRDCYGNWLSENWSGDGSPSWKGGWEGYYGSSWESQRRKALERDTYTCKRCRINADELGRNPDVHHKIPFRVFGKENHKQANRLTNLVTVCGTCHKEIETFEVSNESQSQLNKAVITR